MENEDALVRGSVKAAVEIHNALVRSGAITSSENIIRELAGIIVRCMVIEMPDDQKKGGE